MFRSSGPRRRRRMQPTGGIETLETRTMLTADLASGVLSVHGSPAADVLEISQQGDTISVDINGQLEAFAAAMVESLLVEAGPGDDTVRINLSDIPTTVQGGAGNDLLTGGFGDDLLEGGLGDDRLNGRRGNDRIIGGAGNDRMLGGSGHDELRGGMAADRLTGNAGNDRMYGGEDNDRLNGGSGHDLLDGGDGDDRLLGGGGRDQMDGGNGDDFLRGQGGADRLWGGLGRDRLFGDMGRDVLDGGDDDDRLHGGSGRDEITGGPGSDRLTGGTDVDLVWHDYRDHFQGPRSEDQLVLDPASPEPLVIRYDFRDQEGTENRITSLEEDRARDALGAWETALGGQVVFHHDTRAPAEQIVNIGVGDLAAVGFTSTAGGILGVGAGRRDASRQMEWAVQGVIWLDEAESWDTTIGNGNVFGTSDVFTVVAHETGHVLGLSDLSTADTLMRERYDGERSVETIIAAAERWSTEQLVVGDFTMPFQFDSLHDPDDAQLKVDATTDEVKDLLDRAELATPSNDAIIVVVDRGGRILGVRVEADVTSHFVLEPGMTEDEMLVFAIDGAVAKARTAAFFSNGDPDNGTLAPLTSRLVRFVSQSTVTEREVDSNPNLDGDTETEAQGSTVRGPGFVAPLGLGGHFPPGVRFTPPVDLFAIEHTNRDSLQHPGADGIRGTLDDPLLLPSRFNVDPEHLPANTDPLLGGNDDGFLNRGNGNGVLDPGEDVNDNGILDPGEDDNEVAHYIEPPESYGFVSGRLPDAQSRGIATLPGGIPLFRGSTLIGGIGVFFPGSKGYASYEQGFEVPSSDRCFTTRPGINAPCVLESEYIGFAAAGGSSGAGQTDLISSAPDVPDGLDLPFGRLDLVGIQLEVYGPIAGIQGVRDLVRHGRTLVASGGSPTIVFGTDQPLDAAGTVFSRAGLPVAEGYLVEPHDSTVDPSLTGDRVREIIDEARAEADRVRAAVRLPLSSRTRMVIAVADTSGEVLGLFRMRDATFFSLDVAVAKARNTAYFADADPTSFNPLDGIDGIPAGTAFTNRTFRFLSEPRFPDGIDGSPPPAFSILNNDTIDPKTGLNRPGMVATVGSFDREVDVDNGSVLGYDAFFPNTNFHDPNEVSNQNGIVFFPGSAPLYVSSLLVGGLGVSGDGVDQDDVVTAAGTAASDGLFLPPAELRADQFRVGGVRLPYIKFLRNPRG